MAIHVSDPWRRPGAAGLMPGVVLLAAPVQKLGWRLLATGLSLSQPGWLRVSCCGRLEPAHMFARRAARVAWQLGVLGALVTLVLAATWLSF